MRGLVARLVKEKFVVDLETICVGHQRSDDHGRLVHDLEAREFLAGQADPEAARPLSIADAEEFADALAKLTLDPAREALADRKWCWLMAGDRLAHVSIDAVDALAEIEEFWVEWSYPGPYGMLSARQWTDAEDTLKTVLERLREWHAGEREAIRAVDAPNGGRNAKK